MWQQVDFIWPFQLHFPPAELQLTIERQIHPRLRTSYIKFEVLVVVALMLMVIVSNPSETRNNII